MYRTLETLDERCLPFVFAASGTLVLTILALVTGVV